MPILRDMIKRRKTTRNQTRRWRKCEIIPSQVLNDLWDVGIKIEDEPPETGMGLKRFLELLWQFVLSCPDKKTSAAALNLYEDTVIFELMPDWKNKMRPKKVKLKWPHRTEKSTTISIKSYPDAYSGDREQ